VSISTTQVVEDTFVIVQFPLFEKDDCMDAGGRVTHGAVAEGLGEIF
jgi:hypothetical protein